MESHGRPAIRQSDKDKPIKLSQYTSAEDVERWLQLTHLADDPHTALEYAQRAVDLHPDDPRVQESLQRIVLEKLRCDPFVAFIAETERHYVVTFRNSRPIVIPKARANPDVFPPPQRTESERVLGMIWWIVLGLLPAGLGALILAPLTMRRAFAVLSRPNLNARERRQAWLAVCLAGTLGFIGEVFVVLLVIHLIG